MSEDKRKKVSLFLSEDDTLWLADINGEMPRHLREKLARAVTRDAENIKTAMKREEEVQNLLKEIQRMPEYEAIRSAHNAEFTVLADESRANQVKFTELNKVIADNQVVLTNQILKEKGYSDYRCDHPHYAYNIELEAMRRAREDMVTYNTYLRTGKCPYSWNCYSSRGHACKGKEGKMESCENFTKWKSENREEKHLTEPQGVKHNAKKK